MASKVKILGVLIFICLIDSLHSASYERTKREADEETSPGKVEETSDHKESEATATSDKDKTPPFDMNTLIDNIGQIFNVNGSPDWIKEASSWFTNVPNMFGKH